MAAENTHPFLQTTLEFLHNQSVEGRIQATILDLVNQSLRTQQIVLSQPEKARLLKLVEQAVLTDMLKNQE